MKSQRASSNNFTRLHPHSCTLSVSLDHEVDGETIEGGLTESMVACLFPSFKKQVKFQQLVSKLKEYSSLITLSPVPEEECPQLTSSATCTSRQVFGECFNYVFLGYHSHCFIKAEIFIHNMLQGISSVHRNDMKDCKFK